MADSLILILDQIDRKIKGLNEQISRLRKRNEELAAENADLRLRAEEADRQRDRAQLDAEFMAVSHKLADDPDSLLKARRHIAQLIRNIDRCLEMLKE